MLKLRSLLSFCLVCLAASSAAAQTGGLHVIVEDASGRLPGASVTIASDRGKIAETAQRTDSNGEVVFPVLIPGEGYRLVVAFPGLGTRRYNEVSIPLGRTLTLRVTLADELQETVAVRATGDVVDLEKQESSTRFSDEFIENLPVKGRFYDNILTLAPGVQDANEDGNPTVHGSRARDFKAMVGGISNVDPFTGQKLANVNPNAIDEIEIITAGAGPEYGRAQGGYANLVLKQGGNRFEGVVEWYARDSIFDGDGARNVPKRAFPDFSASQPSVQISGPILKDRLWYRLSHERISRDEPFESASGFGLVGTEQRIVSDQITWQMSPRNKLALRYDRNPLEQTNFGLSRLKTIEATEDRNFDTSTWSLTWDAPFSPTVYVRSIVVSQDSGSTVAPSHANAPNACVIGEPFISFSQCLDTDTGETSGSYWLRHRDDRQRFTVKSDLTFHVAEKFLGMRHEIRSGFIVENERYLQDEFRGTDILKEITGVLRRTAAITLNVSVPDEGRLKAAGTVWGFYLKDTLRPTGNVSIDLGFRLERETIRSGGISPFDPRAELEHYEQLVEDGLFLSTARRLAFTGYEGTVDFRQKLAEIFGISNSQAISFFGPLTNQAGFLARFRRNENLTIQNTNLSPFLAASWDPFGDGKTKIAASFGRHYNNIPLNVPAVELQAPRVSLGLEASRINSGEFVVPDISGARGSLNPAASVFTVDHELRTPYQDEFTFTMERELWNESSVKLLYVRRNFRDQLQDVDINHTVGDFGTCFFGGLIPSPDGELDDCIGATYTIPETGFTIDIPDGVLDVYTLNPFWGSVYKIGNNNQSEYEGAVVEFVRRQFRGWQMQASYTWSIARGDGEDFQQEFGNEPFNLDQEYGFQSTDQRHVVKVIAATVTPWGFNFGGTLLWQTGLPYSNIFRSSLLDALPPSLNFGTAEPRIRTLYPSGSRNDERNPATWTIDIKATKSIAFDKRVHGQVSMEVFNLFNDGTESIYNPFLESGRTINSNNESIRRFGRSFQLGLRVSF